MAKHHPALWRSTSDAAHVDRFTLQSPLWLISSRTHSKHRFAITVRPEPPARVRAKPPSPPTPEYRLHGLACSPRGVAPHRTTHATVERQPSSTRRPGRRRGRVRDDSSLADGRTRPPKAAADHGRSAVAAASPASPGGPPSGAAFEIVVRPRRQLGEWRRGSGPAPAGRSVPAGPATGSLAVRRVRPRFFEADLNDVGDAEKPPGFAGTLSSSPAVGRMFLAWRERRGLRLEAVSPLHVAAYIRTHPGSAPTVKQHLAAIRMLCDWLVVSQVLPVNPAAAVRGPKHVVTKGAPPVLSPTEARKLLKTIDTGTLASKGSQLTQGRPACGLHSHTGRP